MAETKLYLEDCDLMMGRRHVASGIETIEMVVKTPTLRTIQEMNSGEEVKRFISGLYLYEGRPHPEQILTTTIKAYGVGVSNDEWLITVRIARGNDEVEKFYREHLRCAQIIGAGIAMCAGPKDCRTLSCDTCVTTLELKEESFVHRWSTGQ